MSLLALLIRHGATRETGCVLTGRSARLGLDAEGRAQATALRPIMVGVDAVHASPSLRARETAAIAAPGRTVEVFAALDEIDFGEWVGRAFGDLDADIDWRAWNERRDRVRPPGGERMADAGRRMGRHLQATARAMGSGRVAIFGHGDVIKAVLLGGLGLTMAEHHRFTVPTGSVSAVTVERGAIRTLSIGEPAARWLSRHEEPTA